MAYEGILQKLPGAVAAGDLSTKQFHFVAVDEDGQMAVQTVAGARCIGVLNDKPTAAGRACEVAVFGISKVVAGGAIAVGAEVTSSAAGRAAAAAAGNYVMGTALEAADADGDIIPVFINPTGPLPA